MRPNTLQISYLRHVVSSRNDSVGEEASLCCTSHLLANAYETSTSRVYRNRVKLRDWFCRPSLFPPMIYGYLAPHLGGELPGNSWGLVGEKSDRDSREALRTSLRRNVRDMYVVHAHDVYIVHCRPMTW